MEEKARLKISKDTNIGWLLSVPGAIWCILVCVAAIAGEASSKDPWSEPLAIIFAILILMSPGLLFLLIGSSKIRLVKKFKVIAAALSNDSTCSIHNLAAAARRPVASVIVDLEKMCKKGYFPSMRIDTKEGRVFFPLDVPAPADAKRKETAGIEDVEASVPVECVGCGASVQVYPGVGAECEYCGRPLDVPAPRNIKAAENLCSAWPQTNYIAPLLTRYQKQVIDKSLFFAPAIPPKKAESAIRSYAPGLLYDEILVLLDNTVFGGAKEGLIVASNGLYKKEISSPPVCIPLANIKTADVAAHLLGPKLILNGQQFFHATQTKHATLRVLAQMITEIAEVYNKKATI